MLALILLFVSSSLLHTGRAGLGYKNFQLLPGLLELNEISGPYPLKLILVLFIHHILNGHLLCVGQNASCGVYLCVERMGQQ